MSIFDHEYELPEGLSSRLDLVLRRIQFTRRYTLLLLDDLDEADWYWSPDSYTTHIAWQVGHIAMSHYGLTLFRQRGRAEVDSKLMSGKFRKRFMKGTVPTSAAADYPSPGEILEVLERVYQQTLTEIASFEDHLDDPVDAPHAAFATKFGSLLFASDHEMLHAGQIGMLRRLMGKEPLR
ncbi:DinB family protein [Mariniblastus fucicola]|uniref:DinB superfamily protein n=1 Tax=Mariniblastus fucicola TaxID=980251 RepID=A0A5B9P621_9BACT|nr:DinB family protein [Mariniblastus fucicola]QEG21778.1 DinB superfamily protein [Mariniblastus fucicola]